MHIQNGVLHFYGYMDVEAGVVTGFGSIEKALS